MSDTYSSIGPSQAHLLLNRVFELLYTHPLESSIALSAGLLGGYTLRYLITPSHYPNIDGPPNKNVAFGHLFNIFSAEGIPFHDELHDKYGPVCKVHGMFGKENLFVSDPSFLHEVLVRGADVAFCQSQFMQDFNQMTFGPGLISTKGDVHKAQREMLNPVFTAKHMKSLIPIFDAIAHTMKQLIVEDIGGMSGKELDMLQWCNATALELIGQAGLGHRFGVLEGAESEYSSAIKHLMPAFIGVRPLQAFFPLFKYLRPTALQRKLADWAPFPYVRKLKEIIDVQDEQARTILQRKKDQLESEADDPTDDHLDIMSILLKANMEADVKDRLPEDQILGQINTFILAGHETTRSIP
ncbi:unnamed protein product [Rhizoctonia solani]|uniref:Cytochrome P450 n=1 Tax=Rhizoctonia solani TaxID=456999 RepID=A0A8H3GQJ5_9AGAM|nr:unnamed protein product [Rhizoctonia solani]